MIEVIHQFVLPTAYTTLPPKMKSDEATVMLLAIGLQESRFIFRTQVRGPAHGFWQFERGGGCLGVSTHTLSKGHLDHAAKLLGYSNGLTVDGLYEAIVHNDPLAAVAARLLLWTDPRPLPKLSGEAWTIYNSVWRPGKPHPATWDDFYTTSWNLVKGNPHVGTH